MTLREAYRRGREALERAEVLEAALDAWYLLEYAAGCTRSRFLACPEEMLEESREEMFWEAVQKRAQRIPLQHITGEQEFMGLSFLVSDQVLIPRQDTEILVEEVLKFLKPGMRFLDICTGSGCILLSLLHACPGAEGVGADISAGALGVARKNKERLSLQADLVQSDLFLKLRGKFDVIVSNPPYIRRGEIPALMEEVRGHEPWLALDGHEDGLFFYRRIAGECRPYLKEGGRLYLEIGCDQGTEVPGILREQGFAGIQVVKDLAGLDRVVIGTLTGGC